MISLDASKLRGLSSNTAATAYHETTIKFFPVLVRHHPRAATTIKRQLKLVLTTSNHLQSDHKPSINKLTTKDKETMIT